MARNRRPGEAPSPPTRGRSDTPLAQLLTARRFRIGVGAERVAANLIARGAQVSPDATAWIGASDAPRDAPSLSLGLAPGTLGPHSYGFLNNSPSGLGVVAALDLPAAAILPRAGRLGIVVPGRDALPDLLPLLCARDLPISWLISVGQGDPSEVLAFLSEDAGTDAIALAIGEGARAPGLRAALGAKPTVVFGGDPMCRAVATRAGAHVVDRIGEWLALGALLGAGITLDAPVELWIAGGGLDWIRGEAQRYEVDATIVHLDERDPDAVTGALAAALAPRLIVLVGAGETAPTPTTTGVCLVTADTRQPEQVSRLMKALGAELARRQTRGASAPAPFDAAARPHDPELVARVRAETDGNLGDHDTKRLLKAWGMKVTRQGPTGTPTGAMNLARTLDLPVLITRGDDERLAETMPEVRRIAALLLEIEDGSPRSVMVREPFPDAPRARVRVTAERGVGLTMRVGDAIALLPLDAAEALRLAKQSGARRAADQRTVAEVLVRLGTIALAESATLDLELYSGAEPAILRATAVLRRPGAGV